MVRRLQRGSPLTFQVSSPSGEGPHKGPQVHAWTWSRRPTFGPWATSLQYRAIYIYMTRHNGRAACHSRTTHGFDVTNHVNPSVHGQKPPTVRMARQWMTSSTSSLRHSCSIRLPNALGVANDAAERTAAAAKRTDAAKNERLAALNEWSKRSMTKAFSSRAGSLSLSHRLATERCISHQLLQLQLRVRPRGAGTPVRHNTG